MAERVDVEGLLALAEKALDSRFAVAPADPSTVVALCRELIEARARIGRLEGELLVLRPVYASVVDVGRAYPALLAPERSDG